MAYLKKTQKRYYEKNKEKRLEQSKNYYLINKEKRSEYAKEWYQKKKAGIITNKKVAEQELYKIAEFLETAQKEYTNNMWDCPHCEKMSEALKLTAEDIREYTKIICNKKIK